MGERYRAYWSDLGLVEYEAGLALQKKLISRVMAGGPGYVLFLEHPPTITLGYSLRGDEGRSALRSSREELARAGVQVVETDRGGKATYHGPGQLVCYLLLSLKELRLGVKRYVGKLQEVVLATLKELGLPAELDPLYPGVWVQGAKIAAVGIRVTERVTSHGFALNLAPDLAMFSHIVPCGVPDRPVTSLQALVPDLPAREEVIARLLHQLEKTFRMELVPEEPENKPTLSGKERKEMAGADSQRV